MSQDAESSRPGISFHPVNTNIVAGNDITLSYQHTYQNVTVNNPESSILTRLKNALNPVTSASYDSYEAKQRSECFPNTRVHVLTDIEAWIHGESHQTPIYVLDGVAGIGKSTVAQTIAARAAALGLLGASFFFSRDQDLRRVARHFFPTIAYQLGCFNGQFATRIVNSLDQNPDAPAKRLYQQLSLLLLEPLQDLLSQKSQPTLLVVDALDECEEENAAELLSLLGQHIHQIKGLKVLLTTRPEWHLRNILDQDKNHERFRLHEIEDSIVHSDIRLYLKSRLSIEEIRKVSRNRRNPWQPTAREMEMLCGICGTLFIIAATATRFILDHKRLNPEKQLGRLLEGVSESDFTGSKHTNILDKTYIHVILAAQSEPDGGDESWLEDLNKVLGVLITLIKPLPCKALASLLDMDPGDVEATLSQLHSLVAPSGSGEEMMFRIRHKSFPDFITDRERIRIVLDTWKTTTQPELDFRLWINVVDQHLRLAKACFRIMNRDLKWNMANIDEDDWHKDKDDIPYISPKLISQDLAYAALSWASHLRSAHRLEDDPELQSCLNTWTSRHILSWIEVMVIVNQVDGIYDILQDAIESLKCIGDLNWAERARVRELLSDASRFVQQGIEVMKISPMHIYRSCLPLVPLDTPLCYAYGTMAMVKIEFERSHQWDSLLATLIGHSDQVSSVAFSGDDSRLASGSFDKTIRLWDAKTGTHISTLTGHSLMVMSLAFSSDSSRLASGSFDYTIRLWDAKTGAHISTLTGHSSVVRSVDFSRDGSQLASGSDDYTIRLWDAGTGAHILSLTSHSRAVKTVAFSSDFRLASGSDDSTIRLWNARTGTHIFTLAPHSRVVTSVAFSSDGSRLASGTMDGIIQLWNPKTGEHIFTLTGHSTGIVSIAMSSDGSVLASGSYDHTIRFWNAKTAMHISTFSGLFNNANMINSLAFSSDGSRLACGASDGTIRLFDVKVVASVSTPTCYSSGVTSITYSLDGSRLASGSSDATIHLWAAETGAHLITLTGHSDLVASVAFSSDGTRLVSGSLDGTIRLWDVNTGAHVFTLSDHFGMVRYVAFSGDGSRLTCGYWDSETLRVWDAKTGAYFFALSYSDIRGASYPLGGIISVAFSNDGSQVASAINYEHDIRIRLWDAEAGACICTIAGFSSWVDSVAVSNNRCLLASGLRDGTIQLWDTKAGTQISAQVVPPSSHISSVVFLHDSSRMVDQVVSSKSRLPNQRNTDTSYLLVLMKRKNPPISGLVLINLPSKAGGDLKGEAFPLFWFPPDMEVRPGCLAINHANSKVAIGCRNGRVMLLDFSPYLTRPI